MWDNSNEGESQHLFLHPGAWGRTVPAAGASRAAVPRWAPGHAWAAQVGSCARDLLPHLLHRLAGKEAEKN